MREIVMRKSILLSAIGIICLALGTTYGLMTKDKIMVIMSIIIFAVNIYKIFELNKIEKKKEYIVISGRCIGSEYKFIGKCRIFRIERNGEMIEISLPDTVKMRVNEKYKMYFKKCVGEREFKNNWIKNKILSENFLGYELHNNHDIE